MSLNTLLPARIGPADRDSGLEGLEPAYARSRRNYSGRYSRCPVLESYQTRIR